MPPPHPTSKARHRWQRRRAHRRHVRAYLRGTTLAEVGALYGIGRERVRQLFYMEFLTTCHHGWHPPGDPRREDYLA